MYKIYVDLLGFGGSKGVQRIKREIEGENMSDMCIYFQNIQYIT